MNLHDIRIAHLEQYVWYQITGGNGRRLGDGRIHAFLTQRGTPPPMVAPENIQTDWLGRRRGQRYYWTPWPHNGLDANVALNPICGRLQTRARFPWATPAANWELARCPDCERLQNVRYLRDLQIEDPWFQIPTEDRPTTPDPVTGV